MYCRELLVVGADTQLHNYTVQAQYGNLLGKRAHTQLVRERSSSVVSACLPLCGSILDFKEWYVY